MSLVVDLDTFFKPFFWIEEGNVTGKGNSFPADVFKLMIYGPNIITEFIFFFKFGCMDTELIQHYQHSLATLSVFFYDCSDFKDILKCL